MGTWAGRARTAGAGGLAGAPAAIARGGALFLGIFITVGLVGVLRGASRDINLWWVDLRDLPLAVQALLLAAFAAALLAWALHSHPPVRLRRATAVLALVFAALAVRDAIRFYDVIGRGLVHPMLPLPLSALIAVALVALAAAVVRMRDRPAGRRPLAGLAAGAAAWLLLFPLAQMLFFGTTDYRRPADAAVVFGARVYASGIPSPLLRDRIRAGVDLYQAGLVPVLVVSGGDGADGFNEAVVMREQAVALGVPASAILVAPAGVTTEATVANVLALVAPPSGRPLRILAVSQAYHLPRVELAFEAAGVDPFTVPAAEVAPIGEMPLFVAREIPAFWSYFLRDCLF